MLMLGIVSSPLYSLLKCICIFCSGFNLSPVSRLRSTWERLPGKYEKLLAELQDVFDPSRNMAKYRNLLNKHNLQPPVIPLFPVIKKDLTFLHEGNLLFSLFLLPQNLEFGLKMDYEPVKHVLIGNNSKVDGLVNFEKLRMIAREIRHVVRMASITMDPALLFKTRYTHSQSVQLFSNDISYTQTHIIN